MSRKKAGEKEDWKGGRMEDWKGGRREGWKTGRMKIFGPPIPHTISNSKCYSQFGTCNESRYYEPGTYGIMKIIPFGANSVSTTV